MANIESTLEKETLKWLKKLEREVRGMIITGEVRDIDSSIENIHAYISDCKHFLEKKDLVNAFEAVVYAWGIWETLKHLKLIE